MMIITALTLAATLTLASADGVMHSTAAQLRAAVSATTPEGVVSAPLPSGPGATALIVRRTQDGVVEIHTGLNDIFVVQRGSATLLVGGTVTGNHSTAPGEFRGGSITSGRAQSLAPGDAVWIPAGIPHQLLVRKGQQFTYLAFKFVPQPVAAK